MPYAFIPEKAVEAMPKLSGVATKVMVALATFMPGRRQEGCYPSLAAIGERAGINREKTVTAAIKELVAAGILVRERRRRQTNLLKWATLEQANSAGTRVLEPAVSALSKTLEPAVSAQVYPAVSAP
ncbi:MAG: helix-turn-helix domain-containing protein [Planctomycetaceae bacterium]|nr:helix-turn-helix domain-containing protein [Planctomycetaceae bacterium]